MLRMGDEESVDVEQDAAWCSENYPVEDDADADSDELW